MNKFGPKDISDKIRFEKYLMPVTESGCIIFTGALTKGGYGWFGAGPINEPTLAHRFAWELVNGPIPSGICVCHHCDVRSCCNVDHLFMGTQADNIADMVSKGRQNGHPPSGERNPAAILSNSDVKEIKKRLMMNERGNSIAKHFKVNPSIISRIKSGKIWAHIVP